MSVTGQPIIRGVQAVGAVSIRYRYNKKLADGNYELPIPGTIKLGGSNPDKITMTSGGLQVAGFRLDGEFLRANPQIASSVVIPILGGGGVALTNNNRTGTLTFNCTKVSTPGDAVNKQVSNAPAENITSAEVGAMVRSPSFGPLTTDAVYDMVFLAQVQQGQTGGDSVGATIAICFDFCGQTTIVQFDGCTVASVDPLALTGNDAASYNVAFNYLNWQVYYNQSEGKIQEQ